MKLKSINKWLCKIGLLLVVHVPVNSDNSHGDIWFSMCTTKNWRSRPKDDYGRVLTYKDD